MEIIRPIVQDWCVPAQYTSSPEVIKNCLQEVLEDSILKPQVSAPANEDMTKKQREKYSQEAHGAIYN